MSTVSKEIADAIIAGEFPEDDAIKIVEYDNMWGGKGYGVIFRGQNPNMYAASESVRNPKIYWENP